MAQQTPEKLDEWYRLPVEFRLTTSFDDWMDGKPPRSSPSSTPPQGQSITLNQGPPEVPMAPPTTPSAAAGGGGTGLNGGGSSGSGPMAGLQSADPTAPDDSGLSNVIISGPSTVRQDIGKRNPSPLASLAAAGLRNIY